MHVITRKRLNVFAEKHPNSRVLLEHWYRLMKRGHFLSFVELRTVFPHAQSEYQRLTEVLDNLIDVVGEDEDHPLASLMEVIGVLIEKYEDEHVPELTEM